MKRTQIQLDEPTYQALRKAAYERGQSLSAVAREAIARGLESATTRRPLRMEDFADMIGAGASDDDDLAPVSVRHDEALEKILWEDIQRGKAAYRRWEKRRKREGAKAATSK